MSGPEVEVETATAVPRVERVPRSHLSLELGHLYMEDLLGGPKALDRHFAAVKPWADFLLKRHEGLRVSTCFLVDEYFSQVKGPAELIPELLDAAAKAGLTIDYVARESACAAIGAVSPAELLLDRIVPVPAQGSDGSRPSPQYSGWLTNSEHGIAETWISEAMAPAHTWSPPSENGARAHSISMDVQLWDEPKGVRRWSCAHLAAVWQMLRLGLLRYEGRAVVEPVVWTDPFPDTWAALPAVVHLPPGGERPRRPRPFAAYRTMTILETRFAKVEQAVRLILEQTSVDGLVAAQAVEQARAERVELPPEPVRRISHVFTDPS
ncbi:SCO2522 family protein [Actinocorallia sp. A-T 12471]|uniref:SCO2522 family protein n=1 Tax=Actinocorallia sp. A-T 12471 TaxID=3089813 RepID=UPI0029D0C06E|nr:SCO2522 family protein [Actinocorallia sp. A-T 12471]MDX6739817.1 SCO2522 family protein [Actinocorallia sp. A-T 12471]